MQKFVTFSRRHGAGIGVMTEEVYQLADCPHLIEPAWHMAESAELAVERHYEAQTAERLASRKGDPFEYYEHNPQGRGVFVRRETTETQFRFQLPLGRTWSEVLIDQCYEGNDSSVVIHFTDGTSAECLMFSKDVEDADYSTDILQEGQAPLRTVTVLVREVSSPHPPIYDAPLIYTYEGLTDAQIADEAYLKDLVAGSRIDELGADDGDRAAIAEGLTIDLVFKGKPEPLQDFRL